MIPAIALTVALSGNATAQADFNHGLVLCYAYNGEDAKHYFDRALTEDPKFAMAAWGEALAAGPDLNTDMTEQRFENGASAMKRARAMKAYASPAEQTYIDTMSLRFRGRWQDQTADETAYRAATISLANANPNDNTAQVLAAEALLERGESQPAKAFVVRALQNDANDVMANHLCIHLYDDLNNAAAAIPCAQRLDALAVEPAAEHLAHMPAHTWIETGDYSRAVASSQRALDLFTQLLADGKSHADHQRYLKHDAYIGYSAAMMGSNYAIATAMATRAQAAYNKPFLALTALRFGHTDDAMNVASTRNTPGTPGALVRAWILAEHGDWQSAERIAATFDSDLANSPLADLVRARIAESKGDAVAALQAYDRAEASQHKDFSAEVIPLFPAETERGAYYLRQHEYQKAEASFQAALKRYPNDPRALYGIAEALTAQHKDTTQAQQQFNAAWTNADTQLDLTSL